MLSFRVKPSTSQQSRRSQTPQPNAERCFPFSKKKLKVSGWEESLTIRRFKSNAQISRRNFEFIPNLKTLKIQNQKVSIVKFGKNQYNIFMRRQESGKLRSGVECINGTQNHSDKDSELFLNSKLMSVNRMTAHRRSSLIFGSQAQRSQFATNYSATIPLHITGQSKCLSPSRSGSRAKNTQNEDRIIIF